MHSTQMHSSEMHVAELHGSQILGAPLHEPETHDAQSYPPEPDSPQAEAPVNVPAVTEETCVRLLAQIRWPDGPRCVRCGGDRVRPFVATGRSHNPRRLYWCGACDYQYSPKVGTLFHHSHLPLRKWFSAIELMYSTPGGVSAKRLQGRLRISYESAWTMAQRIRMALDQENNLCKHIAERLVQPRD